MTNVVDQSSNRDNFAATLLNLLPDTTTEKVLRLKGHGANAQFDYHLRNTSGAAVDAATWEALRFRRVGPTSASVATYSRSGTTVTVTHTAAHNLETGDLAYHTSPTDTAIEAYRKVTVTSSLIYTFTTAATGAATGSITLQPAGPEVKYRASVTPTSNLESGW